MAGNVWQWTQDCYADSYASARADGSAIIGISAWDFVLLDRSHGPPLDFRAISSGRIHLGVAVPDLASLRSMDQRRRTLFEH
jgi:formylglycine-generating enzyme required for sulfatase activity